MVKGKLFFIAINSMQQAGVITKSEYKMTVKLITYFNETFCLIFYELTCKLSQTVVTESIKQYNT